MQLNEIKAASQKIDELSTLTYSGRVREHDKTGIQQSISLSSEIQYELYFIAYFLYRMDYSAVTRETKKKQLILVEFNKVKKLAKS